MFIEADNVLPYTNDRYQMHNLTSVYESTSVFHSKYLK
jgi:hypothetical protein